MSKIALSGNPAGSGTFTIASPNSNTDRTLTLPDATGTVALTSQIPAAPTIASTAEAQAGTNNTNFITPLRMREGFNASGSAPVYACRAWVNFNGTGTVAIRASGNVSSITDNGEGDYTINFSTAMPDANYCPVTQSVGESTTSLRGGSMIMGTWAGGATLKTTTQLRIYTGYTFTTNGAIDSAEVNVSIFR